MSSYNLSIKALLQGRRSGNITEIPDGNTKRALLVSMKTTPEHSRLHFADKEIIELIPICKEMAHTPIEPGHTKQDIMSRLPLCRIFHFAGHGYTDATDPSQSSLLLKDWKSDRFTVSSLFDLNLKSRSPFLAYLSACGTGEVVDERFYDESIHLISAFLLAGFRHVIGTLWEVNDEICVDMARITYLGMKDGNMTDEAVCLGLHKATIELRDRWLDRNISTNKGISSIKDVCNQQPQNNARIEVMDESNHDVGRFNRKWVVDDSNNDGNQTETLPLWVPYVHFGV